MPDSLFWHAPTSARPLDWTVRVPGSKSATARALYLAAVSQDTSRIEGALRSRDSSLMMDALRAFGAHIDEDDVCVNVVPWDVSVLTVSAPDVTIHTGLAGTVMRFVPLLAVLRPGVTHFVGDAEAEKRPLQPLLDVARQLGAEVTCHGREGYLPVSIRGVNHGVSFPEVITVDASASSQFLSATLLVAPLLGLRDGKAHRVEVCGEVVSLPHVQMTIEALREHGIEIEETVSPLSWRVQPGRPQGGTYVIEPDLTNAGVFLVAAMLCGGRVRILDWPSQTTQAGDAWRSLLSELGATITHEDGIVELTAPPLSSDGCPRFPGRDWDFSAIGELTPTATALLLFADSPSSIRGVEHIRGHETDRLAALANEIRAVGGLVVEHPDGLSITPAPLSSPSQGRPLRAYADHRMATFAALVGLRVPRIALDDVECTSKTLPGFASLWEGLVNGSPVLTQPVLGKDS